MRILTACALISCVLVLPGAAQNVSPGKFSGGLIRIYSTTQGTASFDVGRHGPSAGDGEYRGLVLWTRGGSLLGYGVSTCVSLGRTLPSRRSICTNIYVLPRGTIVTEGLRARRDYYVLPILGGSGLYSNVGGQLIASTASTNPDRERLFFSLET